MGTGLMVSDFSAFSFIVLYIFCNNGVHYEAIFNWFRLGERALTLQIYSIMGYHNVTSSQLHLNYSSKIHDFAEWQY